MIVLGILAAGGVFTGTNPGYTPLELSHHISVTKAKIFLVEPELLKPMSEAMKRAKIQNPKIILFNHDSNTMADHPSWRGLLEHGEADWPRFNDEHTCRNTTAMLLTTSGTTGLPKAAMISHYNLIAEHTLVWERHIPRKPFKTQSIVALPMFHAAMAPYIHTSVLRSGFKTWVMRRFDVDEFMAAIHKYRPSELLLVPPIVLRVVMHPDSKSGKYDLSCIKSAGVGAAPLDSELQRKFEALIGGNLTQGMSGVAPY
jgi:4-coumarate--CoA ligase